MAEMLGVRLSHNAEAAGGTGEAILDLLAGAGDCRSDGACV